MNILMTTVIVAYLVITFGIAYSLKRRVKDNEDFLLAGRKMGIWLTAAMLLAINFGGAFVLGTSQDAYSVGFAAISFALGICFGLVFLGIFVVPRIRQENLYTVPGFLVRRYSSSSIGVIASLVSVLALTGILAGQMGAAGSALTALGLDRTTAVIVGSILIVLFTVMSGMWGVAITDFIQFWVIVVGLLVVTFIAVSEAGGIAEIAATYKANGDQEAFNPLNQGWTFALGAALPVIVHKQVGQDVMQRVFAAKTTKAARWGAIIAGVSTAVFAVFPALAGMAAKEIFPDLDPNIGVVPALIDQVLPVWAAGIIIAALISAVLSTADALLLAAVSNLSHDLLSKVKTLHHRSGLALSRIMTVVLGAIGLILTLFIPNIITILTMAFTMYGSGVFVPFIFGLFTNFGGRWAANSALVIGASTSLLGILKVLEVNGIPTIVLGIGASFVTFIVVGLVAHERNQKVVQTKAHA